MNLRGAALPACVLRVALACQAATRSPSSANRHRVHAASTHRRRRRAGAVSDRNPQALAQTATQAVEKGVTSGFAQSQSLA
jgi:hypothetical protein